MSDFPMSITDEFEEEELAALGCKNVMSLEKAERGCGAPVKVAFILGALSERFIMVGQSNSAI